MTVNFKNNPKIVASYWREVLSNPDIEETLKVYDALKGEAGEDGESPLPDVMSDLNHLAEGGVGDLCTNNQAQTIQFLKELAISSLQSLSSAENFYQNKADTKHLELELKRRLAQIEALIPLEEVESLSMQARNAQRQPGPFGYRNKIYGTLPEPQRALLEAMQWKTATGSFEPVSGVARFIDGFVEERLKAPVSSLILTKVIGDAILLMTDINGPHQAIKDEREKAGKAEIDTEALSETAAASENDQLLSAFFGGEQKSEEELAQIDSQNCITKLDEIPGFMLGPNFIAKAIDSNPELCVSTRDSLQTAFEITLAAPSKIQAAQKQASEALIQPGTVMAESYDDHHALATKKMENFLLYDNGYHIALLAIAASIAAPFMLKTIKEKGLLGATKKVGGLIAQRIELTKNRPWTFYGTVAGGALYCVYNAASGVDANIVNAAPWMLGGGVLGYLEQRERVHYKENKEFIFGLYNDKSKLAAGERPITSFDKIKKHRLLYAALGYMALSYGALELNNAGAFENAPMQVEFAADCLAASWAWLGAIVGVGVYDKFDDAFYHEAFLKLGLLLGGGAAVSYSIAESGVSKLIPSPIKEAWGRAVETGKKTIRNVALNTVLTVKQAESEYENVEPKPAYVHTLPGRGGVRYPQRAPQLLSPQRI